MSRLNNCAEWDTHDISVEIQPRKPDQLSEIVRVAKGYVVAPCTPSSDVGVTRSVFCRFSNFLFRNSGQILDQTRDSHMKFINKR